MHRNSLRRAVDVSGSMDEEEHILQRQGFVAAFRHPEVINTIMSGFIGRIAVTYVEWAGPVSQVVTVPWRIVDGKDSAGAFADILADEPIAFIRGTSISGGIEFAAGLFADNGIEGTRRVIDVSGDGANNMGEPVEAARPGPGPRYRDQRTSLAAEATIVFLVARGRAR